MFKPTKKLNQGAFSSYYFVIKCQIVYVFHFGGEGYTNSEIDDRSFKVRETCVVRSMLF